MYYKKFLLSFFALSFFIQCFLSLAVVYSQSITVGEALAQAGYSHATTVAEAVADVEPQYQGSVKVFLAAKGIQQSQTIGSVMDKYKITDSDDLQTAAKKAGIPQALIDEYQRRVNNSSANNENAAYIPAAYSDTTTDTASGLIPCTNECDFNDLLQLINNIITFSIEFLVLPIFIAILIYAGFLYLTANGKPGVHAKVKKMLWSALIGLIIVLSSWLVVKVIISTLGYEAGLRFLE